MADTETIVFATKEIYHMELQITGLLKPGQTPDFTRNGVATGYVVVPEFPSSMIHNFLNRWLIRTPHGTPTNKARWSESQIVSYYKDSHQSYFF